MLRLQAVAMALACAALGSPAWQGLTPTMPGGLKKPPIVTATEAPKGTEMLPVKWVTVTVPDLGVMRAAVARPAGGGRFPAVLVLHGTHGFARQYVEWASSLARAGFIAVAACWFSGGGRDGANEVTPPIPCPDIPPLGPGEHPEAVTLVDALVQATRALPGADADRLALVGHSRGGGATQQYLLAVAAHRPLSHRRQLQREHPGRSRAGIREELASEFETRRDRLLQRMRPQHLLHQFDEARR